MVETIQKQSGYITYYITLSTVNLAQWTDLKADLGRHTGELWRWCEGGEFVDGFNERLSRVSAVTTVVITEVTVQLLQHNTGYVADTTWTRWDTVHHLWNALNHWLPVHYRIIFQICTIGYQALSSTQPAYLNSLLTPDMLPILLGLLASSSIHWRLTHCYQLRVCLIPWSCRATEFDLRG